MDLSQEEINANIAKLRNKIGDVRIGGKGSQRRKLKVVSKNAVIFYLFRELWIRLSRTWSRKPELSSLASMKSVSSEMTTPSCISVAPKFMLPCKIILLLSLERWSYKFSKKWKNRQMKCFKWRNRQTKRPLPPSIFRTFLLFARKKGKGPHKFNFKLEISKTSNSLKTQKKPSTNLINCMRQTQK